MSRARFFRLGQEVDALEIPYIDADVHPMTRRGVADILPYVSPSWRRRIEIYRSWSPAGRRPSPVADVSTGANFAQDAWSPDGSRPGSDPVHVRSHLLDARNVLNAILLPQETIYLSALAAIDDGIEMFRAYNDYFIAEWLAVDSRYRLALSVSPHDPQAAAAEIKRLQDTPGVVAVLLPLINILMGHRHYYPIYEAAEAAGLPVVIHPGSGGSDFQGGPTCAGGIPANYFQFQTLFSELAMSSVVSLVLEGTFQRFPGLKVVMAEFGFTWVPHVIWRMDREWRSLRVETPWLDRPPSEYMHEHITYTTQPFDEPEPFEQMLEVMDMIKAQDVLLFSSDYPHWDNEFPDNTLNKFPADLQRRIAYENALRVFPRLTRPAGLPTASAASLMKST